MKIYLWFAAVIVAFSNTASAEMSPFWQSVAKEPRQLSTAACKGDQSARDRLYEMAFTDENPGAMTSWAWLISGRNCAYYTGNGAFATQLYTRAAEHGYPPALSSIGFRHVLGLHAKKDAERGLKFINRAVNGGYSIAAIHAADTYIDGKHLSQDLSEAEYWLARARDVGAPQKQIDRVETRLAALKDFQEKLSPHEQQVVMDTVEKMAKKDQPTPSTSGRLEWDYVTETVKLRDLAKEARFNAREVYSAVTSSLKNDGGSCTKVDWVTMPQPKKLCFTVICSGERKKLSFDAERFRTHPVADKCRW